MTLMFNPELVVVTICYRAKYQSESFICSKVSAVADEQSLQIVLRPPPHKRSVTEKRTRAAVSN